ncbi:MAG: hypothetical protein LBT40_10175 [Deltaproteobacteria bacterium]|jgi:hypothetical protein|nr:hypothetical protein [Deltaproteobacteria bacterium]
MRHEPAVSRPFPRRSAPALAAALALALLVSLAAARPAAADATGDIFDMVDKFVRLRADVATAADSTWVPFRSSPKERARSEMDGFLDRVLGVLLKDDVSQVKRDISRLGQKNADLQDRIARLEIDKASAPDSSRFYEVWKSSQSDIDKRIASAKRDMASNRADIAEKRGMIRIMLAREGIQLSEDELKNLLMTVSGDDMVDSMVALKNIYQVSGRLRELMGTTQSLAVSRKYYAVFLIATQAHELQLVRFRKKIAEEYIPRLDSIRAENQTLMARTRQLASENAQYRSNLTAQEMTERVAGRYRDLLQNQDKILSDRLAALRLVIRYVENTYETVSLASGLADSMEDSLMNLQALLEMPVVPPVAFESSLEDKFQELSQRISAGTQG